MTSSSWIIRETNKLELGRITRSLITSKSLVNLNNQPLCNAIQTIDTLVTPLDIALIQINENDKDKDMKLLIVTRSSILLIDIQVSEYFIYISIYNFYIYNI